MNKRLPLIVGLILALGTGALLMTYMNSTRSPASAMRTVLVATRDIPARAVIDVRTLEVVQRPGDQLDSDTLTDAKQAAGSISLITIPSGSAITRSKIAKTDALAIPRRLARGLRAVSISIDRVKGVSGLIQPGDRIDVIAVPPRVGNETPRATTILRGALVLAMGAETEIAKATPSPDQNLTTVTLAVTPKQADLLALADVNTTLRLALRAPDEPIRAYPAESLHLGEQPQAIAAAPVAAPAPALVSVPAMQPARAVRPAAPAKRTAAVMVIDGDRFVETTRARE